MTENEIGTRVVKAAILGAGVIGASSAVLSDHVFNAGIALPIAVLLLLVAFMMGVTHMPFAARNPPWRKIAIGGEVVAASTAALYL